MGIFYENLIYGVRILNGVDMDADVPEKQVVVKEIIFDKPMDINDKDIFLQKLTELTDGLPKLKYPYEFLLNREMTTTYDGPQSSYVWIYFNVNKYIPKT